MYKDPLQALLLPLSYPYVQGPTTSTSAASVLPLCIRTHYKHFSCLCPTLMYKDPLQALLLLLSYPYVQGPTTSTSAASVLSLCTGTHYKHFCFLCPTLMYRDPLQALLPDMLRGRATHKACTRMTSPSLMTSAAFSCITRSG